MQGESNINSKVPLEFVGNETKWEDMFLKQTDTGKFWVELHKNGNFNEAEFLMRDDAFHIIHKAQSDILKKAAREIQKKENISPLEVIDLLKQIENETWEKRYK